MPIESRERATILPVRACRTTIWPLSLPYEKSVTPSQPCRHGSRTERARIGTRSQVVLLRHHPTEAVAHLPKARRWLPRCSAGLFRSGSTCERPGADALNLMDRLESSKPRRASSVCWLNYDCAANTCAHAHHDHGNCEESQCDAWALNRLPLSARHIDSEQPNTCALLGKSPRR